MGEWENGFLTYARGLWCIAALFLVKVSTEICGDDALESNGSTRVVLLMHPHSLNPRTHQKISSSPEARAKVKECHELRYCRRCVMSRWVNGIEKRGKILGIIYRRFCKRWVCWYEVLCFVLSGILSAPSRAMTAFIPLVLRYIGIPYTLYILCKIPSPFSSHASLKPFVSRAPFLFPPTFSRHCGRKIFSQSSPPKTFPNWFGAFLLIRWIIESHQCANSGHSAIIAN